MPALGVGEGGVDDTATADLTVLAELMDLVLWVGTRVEAELIRRDVLVLVEAVAVVEVVVGLVIVSSRVLGLGPVTESR